MGYLLNELTDDLVLCYFLRKDSGIHGIDMNKKKEESCELCGNPITDDKFTLKKSDKLDCFGCGHVFPEGETFVKIAAVKEELDGKTFEPYISTIISTLCMECAKKKDFENLVIPGEGLEKPKKDMVCCLCGKIIP